MSLTFSLQALLVRHETHMHEAEEERLRMMVAMERLEADKKELEATNTKTIEENRNLLDQLEGLNNLVADSDVHVQSLEATLRSTQQELQRLTVLAGRAAQLELQLTNLEIEQAQLQVQLKSSDEDQRSAIQRWKRAEGTIGHLQDQIDRIEKEAREERERHVEVLGRLERRRAVEKELDNAAGRLKGAAAVSGLGKYNSGGSNVVSHFVKDILQDNANLQLGIVELREMLMGSNAEVENLREQLQLHQPLEEDENQSTLRAELSKVEQEVEDRAPETKAELHVHHHYHAPEIAVKKPRRKRTAISSGHFLGSGASTPRVQKIRDWRTGTPSSAAAILSQTSVTVPPVRHQHRWSTQSSQTNSTFAASSVPSSPRRTSSVFDDIDIAFDSSRPTTPESSVPGSPLETPKDAKSARQGTTRSVSTPTHLLPRSISTPPDSSTIKPSPRDRLDDFDDPNFSDNSSLPPPTPLRLNSNSSEFAIFPGPEPIPEENENDEYDVAPSDSTAESYLDQMSPKPQLLRRHASHESLLSVSGMDIHTLRLRPSQMLVSGVGFSPRPSLSPASRALTSTQPVFSPETATARPTIGRNGLDSGSYTRSLLTQQRYGSSPQADRSPLRSTLTKRVGGWVWSKWGVSPSPSNENLREKEAQDPLAAMMRRPGVNQSGPIKGLKPPKRTPSQVIPEAVNEQALGEALAEAGD